MPSLRPVRVAAALTVPAAVVLAGLAGLGQIGGAVALGAVAVILVLNLVLARPYLADLARLVAYLRELGRGGAEPPVLSSAAAEDMVGAVAALRRAGAQKSAELAALLGAYAAVLDSLPDPLLTITGQRRILRANAAARDLFGRDLVGSELAAVLRGPALLEAVERVLAGEPATEAEFALPPPLDREFRASLRALDLGAVDGTSAVLALHDITAVRRLDKMRADLVANASHELRTPLASLIGFIETLRGPARDDAEARDRFLAIMHEQAGRMARLVEDLLSLSRIEMNEHSQPADRVALDRLLDGLAAGFAVQAGAKGMRLELALADGLPAVIGQADELSQVFQNLIDNALKYGRDGTAVTVTAAPTRDPRLRVPAVAVAVRDQGEGIAKEHLPRLTERFFRVDAARSRQLGGTGLGLAIVKHIVNHHRGALTIESTPGQGSVFTVYLPAAPGC